MVTYPAEIVDADDGTGDSILQLSPEFCKNEDWREGDTISFSMENESIVMKNVTRAERESLSR